MANRMLLSSLLVTIALCCLTVSNASYPTIQKASLKKLFDSAKPYPDLSSAYFSVKGLQLLGESLPAASATDLCSLVKSKVDKTNLESIFYATELAALSNCALSKADFQAALTSGASSTNVADLFYYSQIAQANKSPIDSKALSKSIVDALKADSSILNQAYSLHIASLLAAADQKTFVDSVEDILEQADEVDKKYLQYEGGVGTTSLVLDGIFALAEKSKLFPAKLDQTRLTKFVNYLTSKRSPINIKSAYYLLRVALKLSDNQFSVPVVLNRLSPVSVSTSQPNVIVALTDILGGAVAKAQFVVEAESAKSQKASLLTAKKAFTAKSSDGTAFELKLIEKQPTADFYTVVVSATPKAAADKRFFLVQKQVEVKATTQIALTDVQIGVADREQSVPKLAKLESNTQLKEKLEADQQTKFHLKFAVKDKSSNANIEVHQAFVRFTELKSGREIVFLAQATSAKLYSADVDFSTNAKNFRHTSGAYSVDLVVSDALVENAIAWKLAEIKLRFSDDQSAAAASAQQSKALLYSKLPEIKHTFRVPEPTPSAVVSTVFTVLCLAPLAIMLIAWIKIGFNLSNFTFSPFGIVFHVALASIFGLFYCYWVQLNMFVTLRWLAIIGGVAFLSGNKLLRGLAAADSNKEKKTN